MKKFMRLLIAALLSVATSTVAPAQYNPSVNTDIAAGTIMRPNASFVSTDGRFTLIFQEDRNFVLYQGTKVLWDADTHKTGCTGTPAVPYCEKPTIQYITFQTDGNLVAYDQFGGGYGISKTQNNPGSHLSLQNDGNLVIYNSANRAIWSTKTCCR